MTFPAIHSAEMRRSAFTLIELVVVIVLLGLLSTLVVTSLGGTTDRYQLSRAAETIELFDARARRQARQFRRPVAATIERNRNRLTAARSQFQLPGRVEIDQIRMRRGVTAGGKFQIRYNREGRSPTYAIELRRGDSSQWVVVLGFSGQIVTAHSEGEVDEILSL